MHNNGPSQRRIRAEQALAARVELLWKLYAENREYARLHENQRSAAANIVIAAAAALIALATFDQRLNISDLPATLFITLVGFFGSVFSSKHYERTRLHLNRAKAYLARLDQLCPADGLLHLQRSGDTVNEAAFSMLSRIKLHTLWNIFFLLVAMFGAVLTALIVHGNAA